jgi:hypothetical protein
LVGDRLRVVRCKSRARTESKFREWELWRGQTRFDTKRWGVGRHLGRALSRADNLRSSLLLERKGGTKTVLTKDEV